MEYRSEKEMYPDVQRWLKRVLESRYQNAKVGSFITERKSLSRFLEERGLHKRFPQYQAFEIMVDVLGVIEEKEKTDLAFVECKLKRVNLRDVSQLLGYSKVAVPRHSIALSPVGVSTSIDTLFNVLRRHDVLRYAEGRTMLIGTWSKERGEVLHPTMIPKGHHL
jgi:hypothetical protein